METTLDAAQSINTSVCLITSIAADGHPSVLLTEHQPGADVGNLEVFEAALKPSESKPDGARRAAVEGCGLEPAPGALHHRATIAHHHPANPERDTLTDVYVTEYRGGSITGRAAPRLRWITQGELPSLAARMPEHLRYWLPLVLAGQCLQAVITYLPDGNGVAETRGTAWLPRRERTS